MYVTGQLESFKRLKHDPGLFLSCMAWAKIVGDEDTAWANLRAVRQFDPNVEFEPPYTVFSLRGNEYKIVTKINYKSRWISILGVWPLFEYEQNTVDNLVNLLKQPKT